MGKKACHTPPWVRGHLSLSLSLSLTHTHTQRYTLSYTHAPSHFIPLSYTHILSHTCMQANTHSHSTTSLLLPHVIIFSFSPTHTLSLFLTSLMLTRTLDPSLTEQTPSQSRFRKKLQTRIFFRVTIIKSF